MSIGDSDIVFYSAGLGDANPFDPSDLDADLTSHGVGCRVVSETWHPRNSGDTIGGFYYAVDPEAGPVSATIKLSTGTLGDRLWVGLVDSSGDGWGAVVIGTLFRICPITAHVPGSGVTYETVSDAAADDEYTIAIDGTALTTLKNGTPVGSYTVTAGLFRPEITFAFDNSGNLAVSALGATGYAPTAPAINPTGTDTDLINGTSADVVFSGLTSDPASIAVVWDNGVDSAISSTQADFSLGTVTDGAATATVTATIGNLPYTDATYLTGHYSYLVTCADASEITFDTLTMSPAAGNSFITVASPVNDSTSILPGVEMAEGDQLEWPDEVVISESNTATLDVLANGQFTIEWSGAAASFTFTLRFWDGSEWFDIATTINTAGEVVSGGGLTRVGLTRIGLTTAGLTAVGLSSAAVTVGLIASTYLTALTEMSNYG